MFMSIPRCLFRPTRGLQAYLRCTTGRPPGHAQVILEKPEVPDYLEVHPECSRNVNPITGELAIGFSPSIEGSVSGTNYTALPLRAGLTASGEKFAVRPRLAQAGNYGLDPEISLATSRQLHLGILTREQVLRIAKFRFNTAAATAAFYEAGLKNVPWLSEDHYETTGYYDANCVHFAYAILRLTYPDIFCEPLLYKHTTPDELYLKVARTLEGQNLLQAQFLQAQ